MSASARNQAQGSGHACAARHRQSSAYRAAAAAVANDLAEHHAQL